MQSETDLRRLSDDDLVRRLAELVSCSRRVEADLVAHIGEVDARRLYAREASPSMFSYCTRRLHLSEAEAYLRITVARAARRHGVLLEMLRDGRLHLRAIALIAPLLTTENREALLERATHRSRREVEELVAELRPQPDVPTRVRRLSRRQATPSGAGVGRGGSEPLAYRLGGSSRERPTHDQPDGSHNGSLTGGAACPSAAPTVAAAGLAEPSPLLGGPGLTPAAGGRAAEDVGQPAQSGLRVQPQGG